MDKLTHVLTAPDWIAAITPGDKARIRSGYVEYYREISHQWNSLVNDGDLVVIKSRAYYSETFKEWRVSVELDFKVGFSLPPQFLIMEKAQ